MKTTKNNNQKTESSSAKRMTVRAAVVILSLIIVSLTSTSAQELWAKLFNEGNTSKLVALELRDDTGLKQADATVAEILATADARLNSSTSAFRVETENDRELNVEAWMLDNPYFQNTDENLFSSKPG